jgi:hypothetical protein
MPGRLPLVLLLAAGVVASLLLDAVAPPSTATALDVIAAVDGLPHWTHTTIEVGSEAGLVALLALVAAGARRAHRGGVPLVAIGALGSPRWRCTAPARR